MFNKKIFGVVLSLGLFFSTNLAISAKEATNIEVIKKQVKEQVKEQNIEKDLYKILDGLVRIFVNDKEVKEIVKENINKKKKCFIKGFPKTLKKLEFYMKKKLKELEKDLKNKEELKRNIKTLKNVLDFINLYNKNPKFKKEVEAYIKKIDMNKVYEKLYSSNLKARNRRFENKKCNCDGK